MRFEPGGPSISARGARELPQSLWTDLTRVVATFPGALVENKRFSFAVHYRLAPESERPLREAVMRLADSSHVAVEVMNAHQAIELKAPGSDKGGAIASFLSTPAFRGRTPIFVGDDTTDESGFAVVAARGGYAFSVGAWRPRRERDVPATERGSGLARGIRQPRGRRMTGRGQTKSQNLDLAVIGNSLLRRPHRPQRTHRVVVFSVLRFRSDIFAAARRRRRQGVLRSHARGYGRDRFPLSAQHSHRRDGLDRLAWRQSARFRFCAVVPAI